MASRAMFQTHLFPETLPQLQQGNVCAVRGCVLPIRAFLPLVQCQLVHLKLIINSLPSRVWFICELLHGL